MIGPCLCGDLYCPSCNPGGMPPEECPICGKNNYDHQQEMLLDETYATCGEAACKAKAQENAKAEAEAEAQIAKAEEEQLANHQKTCSRKPQCPSLDVAEQHEWDDRMNARDD